MDSIKPAPTEEDLAALDAKIEDLSQFLKFLLAQDYLSRSVCGQRYLGSGLHLKYATWDCFSLLTQWWHVIRYVRDREMETWCTIDRRNCEEYIVEPGNSMGIDPEGVIGRVRAVPFGERGKLFSLLAQYVDGGYFHAAKRRLAIDEQWLHACFRTEEQRKSKLYKGLLKAHTSQKMKIDKALGVDASKALGGEASKTLRVEGIPAAPSRGSFSSQFTLLELHAENERIAERNTKRSNALVQSVAILKAKKLGREKKGEGV